MLEWILAWLFVAFVIVFFVDSERKENGGLYFWQRGAVLRRGAEISGVVLDHAEHSPRTTKYGTAMHVADLVVEFTPGAGPPIRVAMSYEVSDGATSELVGKGRTVPLRYDLRNPKRVLIDWDVITGGPRRERTGGERAADRERQAAQPMKPAVAGCPFATQVHIPALARFVRG